MKEIMVDNARALYSGAVTFLADKRHSCLHTTKYLFLAHPEASSALKHSVKMVIVIQTFTFVIFHFFKTK